MKKLGVCIVGVHGAVASTVIAGVHMMVKGLAPRYGMVTEKAAAMVGSQIAAAQAVSRGLRPDLVAHHALAPYRKRVRANLTRLSR